MYIIYLLFNYNHFYCCAIFIVFVIIFCFQLLIIDGYSPILKTVSLVLFYNKVVPEVLVCFLSRDMYMDTKCLIHLQTSFNLGQSWHPSRVIFMPLADLMVAFIFTAPPIYEQSLTNFCKFCISFFSFCPFFKSYFISLIL